MIAKGAIDLELFLGEELIPGRLMRKRGIALLVVKDVIVLVSSERRLETDDNSLVFPF